ncbi:hypothetical protein CCR87_12675 [Rhodobaculum claviforme]|uniref:histidine kinase n=1 Tax=Rhodobaculum claviforme TaxID=1549854 RepID=A0A934TL73_9RHOB|nr:hypothetical protein [Rhodobaculum claviforme]
MPGRAPPQRHRLGAPGAERWVEVTAAPRGPGAAPGHVVALRDVTAAARATHEVEQLSQIARRTGDLVVITDTDHRIDWVNPAFEARTGWRLEDVRGHLPESILQSPEADAAEVARIRGALLEGASASGLLLCRTRTDDAFWAEIDAYPLRDSDGRTTGHVTLATDVTARRAQEAKLERLAQEATRARERLEMAVEALPDAFAFFDAEDRLVLCNERYRTFHPRSGYMISPGVQFADFARAVAHSGDVADAVGREEAWLAERLASHREGRPGGEHRMADGSWLRVIERVTADGGRVGMRVDITELKEAERRLADIIHGAQVGTWEWHLASGENRINARWAEIVGYCPDEIDRSGIDLWRALVHPDDLARAEARLARVFAREIDQFEYELRMRHRDGHWVWVLSRGRVARWSPDGKPEVMAGVHMDITALKRAEERLEAILHAAEAGTWETDPARGGMRINDRWAEMLGYTVDELAPLPEHGFRTLMHPDDRARLEAEFGMDLEGRPDRFSVEVRVRHKAGAWVWLLARGRVLARDANGRPVRTAGIHLDITERKRLEQQLVAERDYMSRLMETNVSGITALDGDGRIIYANREAEAILGLSAAAVDRRSYADPRWQITAPDGGPLADAELPFTRAMTEGRVVRDVRFAIAWPDGTRRQLSVNAAPLLAEGLQARVVCAITDITEQVATEAALRSAAERAEAASEAKSRFLANMSHEIRTPLNGVLGMAQVLEEELSEPRHRRMLEVIRESGEMLLGVLNDVLDMSKIEAGKVTLEQVAFVPADLARRIEAMHALRAAEKHLSLEVVAAPGAERARLGDPGRVEQMLHNLVGNAVKFTEAGGVRVTLEGGCGPLRVVVHDTGIGMTDDQLARIFEDFEQADGTVTRRFGGTGLGMSIVRRLVALMGGQITVDSIPGAGTQVRVALPLPLAEGGPRDAVPVPAQPLEGLRALAADDNATNRLILQAMLSALGGAVTMVPDGQAAVEAWAPGRFDLILLDISMPGLDGLGALAAIRLREAEAGVPPAPAVAITANAMAHQVAQYMGAGFAAHVGKPFRREDLARTLLRVLDRAPPAQR